MSAFEMKAIATFTSLVVSIFGVGVMGYLTAYSMVKYKPKWQRGRGVGVSLQGGLVTYFVILIPLLGTAIPRFCVSVSGIRDWQPYAWVVLGLPMLVSAAMLEASLRYVDIKLRRYLHLLHLAIALAGLAMLVPGLAWLTNASVPDWIPRVLVGTAYLVAGLTEWLFLNSNGWRFIPDKPR